MAMVEACGLAYRYGKREVLHGIEMTVPEGAIYALLGPNGAGKSTLLQLVMGLRRPFAGTVRIQGESASSLPPARRAAIGYVAEGLQLPGWMRIAELEAFCAPLYPRWDHDLAASLRERFGLDPAQRVRTLSRGEYMKAAMLCALAPRPRLLVMDEPFTGMDVITREVLARELVDAAATEGTTVLLASHDIGELELLADWTGILVDARLAVSAPIDHLRQRFRRVVVTTSEETNTATHAEGLLLSERAGRRLSFMTTSGEAGIAATVTRLPHVERVDVEEVSLREIFTTVVRLGGMPSAEESA